MFLFFLMKHLRQLFQDNQRYFYEFLMTIDTLIQPYNCDLEKLFILIIDLLRFVLVVFITTGKNCIYNFKNQIVNRCLPVVEQATGIETLSPVSKICSFCMKFQNAAHI
ncbi:hypothetical protein BpHYR1_008515 [Brachionus plicatilis]|uniref:Uncharacterized protein n=1 Tax=Brachionus plicatilis TaxID=10195 RepID=A0A3M7T4R1_BRAPC|nr:hypothetical protein BpHYR1_008515 [Brachionus plicatilis]